MKMTILLTETGEMTAGVLECARVMRAITRSRENLERLVTEIESTKKRLHDHLRRFRATRKCQVKRLASQQRELRFQIKRLNALKGAKP